MRCIREKEGNMEKDREEKSEKIKREGKEG